MEFLFELLGEMLIQVVAEALLELGLHSLAEPFRRQPNPWLAAVGYATIGLSVGGLSLAVFPHLLVGARFRLINLIVSPVVSGALMSALGSWRRRRGDAVLRIDRFSYGFLFAVGFAVVRFFFAKSARQKSKSPLRAGFFFPDNVMHHEDGCGHKVTGSWSSAQYAVGFVPAMQTLWAWFVTVGCRRSGHFA